MKTVEKPGRGVVFALLALALGGFGIGCNEFATMGLLPEITRDLLADTYATNQEQALGAANWIVFAYALGVVIGAPTLVVFVMRFPQKWILVGIAASFAVTSVLVALSPGLEFAVIVRFLAGLPHGAYFGVATLVAADLIGGDRKGSGVAYVLAGLTVANIVGVPLVTWVGQQLSWRASMLAIAAVFAAAAAAIAVTVPYSPGDKSSTVRGEVRIFRRPLLWIATLVPAIGNAGFFAVYSYISPISTERAQLPLDAVPWVLAVIGCGMTLGMFIGGKLADRNAPRYLFVTMGAMALATGILFFLSAMPVWLFVSVFVFAVASSATIAPSQVWIMGIADGSQVLAGSMIHGAYNVANALGAAAAGVVVGTGLGFQAPILAGIIFPIVGFLIVGAVLFVRRR